jgi:hypothetical protein
MSVDDECGPLRPARRRPVVEVPAPPTPVRIQEHQHGQVLQQLFAKQVSKRKSRLAIDFSGTQLDLTDIDQL